jgi:DNA (cytosine-5)-methyltransferase 1
MFTRPFMLTRSNSLEASSLTAVDLFCGAGGLTVGLKNAGYRVLAAIDCYALATETYSSNHPDVLVLTKDIRRLPAAQFADMIGVKPGQLDLLAGCPPCQGFSTLRTRNRTLSAKDDRNELVFDFLRYISVLKPKMVLLENVPGLNSNYRMDRVCGKLTRLGYHLLRIIVDAADYGVPQRRRRMLLVASRLFLPKPSRPCRRLKTVRDAIGRLPKPSDSRDPLHTECEQRSERVRAVIRRIPKNGGSRSSLPYRYQLPCHRRRRGFHDVYGRMAWDCVAPTITSGCTNPSKGRFIHPSQHRAITLREAALLQTFPTRYRISLSRGKEGAALLIGNAFPPAMIRTFAAQLRKQLQECG